MSFSHTILVTHAVFMSAAFLIFFPLGAILIRVAPISSTRLHAPWQIFSLALAAVGLGLGIKLAYTSDTSIRHNAHPIIGLVVVSSLILIMPIGGLAQHWYGKRNGGKRTVFGIVHMWFGRAMIWLGMVNGGLGLLLAGDEHDKTRTIPYIVIASVFGGIWVLVVLGNLFRSKGRSERFTGPREKTSFDSVHSDAYDHEKDGDIARARQALWEDSNGTSLHSGPTSDRMHNRATSDTNGYTNGLNSTTVAENSQEDLMPRSGSGGFLAFLHR